MWLTNTSIPNLYSNYTTNTTDCAIVSLLPFTYKGKSPNKQFPINVAIDHMAATLLAMDHFNERDGSIVSELATLDDDCDDLRLPVEPGFTVMDDGDFTTNAVAALLEAREHHPAVCGVVGPYRNKAALGAAHVSGAMESPLLSYGAADTAKLGRLHLYPLTTKMTADEYDRADFVMDYLKNYLQRDYVTLIHTTDLNDHAAKVLDWAAKKHDVEFHTEAVKPPFQKTSGAFR